jgi:hypothetical protein
VTGPKVLVRWRCAAGIGRHRACRDEVATLVELEHGRRELHVAGALMVTRGDGDADYANPLDLSALPSAAVVFVQHQGPRPHSSALTADEVADALRRYDAGERTDRQGLLELDAHPRRRRRRG